MGKKVLVTGGSGMNGSWVIRELLADGYEPVIFDLHPNFSLLEDVRNSIELQVGDVRDIAAVSRALKLSKARLVIHMAALVQFSLIQQNPYLGFGVNGLGTVNVLEAAIWHDVERVVFTSSKAAYGEVKGEYAHPTYKPLPEDYSGPPFFVYDYMKIASEGMGLNYHRAYGIPFIALRFASIYGPGKLARHGALSVLSKLIENAMLGKPTRIPKGSNQKNDFVYFKDVARGIVLALKAEHVRCGVFNIGTGVGHTLMDVAQVIKEFYPKSPIEIGPGLDYLEMGSYYSVFDITQARQQIGYEPAFDLKSGVADYLSMLEQFHMQPTYTP